MDSRCLVACLLVSACYEPKVSDCAFLCGDAPDECPDGTICMAGFCRIPTAQGDCPTDLCGNLQINDGEVCDDDHDDTDDCAHCQVAFCGDGYVRAGVEECDDANQDSDDGCVACSWARCGDNITRKGVEDCDPPGASCATSCIACAPGSGITVHRGADGHCYRRHSMMQDFMGSAGACEAARGHLFTATSETQRNEITGGVLPATSDTWIGLHQPGGEGTFAWVTGEPFTPGWVNLADDPVEACFTQAGGNSVWTDWQCSILHPYLCEHDGWTIDTPIVDNHAFQVFYAPTSWFDAKTDCEAIAPGHSHLATIADDRAQAVIDQLAWPTVWIGATDSAMEGTFVWVTGEAATYVKWDAAAPDNAGNQDCVVMTNTGLWDDAICTELHPYVCEID